jgi:hypothetical protein
MGWFSRKAPPKIDNSELYRESDRKALGKVEQEIREMDSGLEVMSERLQQGQLSAAAIAAQSAGFSHCVTSRLERAHELSLPPTYHERCSVDGLKGEKRERVAFAQVAEAGEYARCEHRQLAQKAKDLRQKLADM